MSDFLFGLDFEVENTRVQLLRPELRRPFEFRCSSNLVLTYAVHFVGRAFICPGETLCPACGSLSKRTLSLISTGTEHNVGLLEIGAQTLITLDRLKADNGIMNLIGTSWTFCRMVAKRPLSIEFKGLVNPEHRNVISDHKILLCFAKLFSLPRPASGVGPSTYADSIRDILAEKLRRQLQL